MKGLTGSGSSLPRSFEASDLSLINFDLDNLLCRSVRGGTRERSSAGETRSTMRRIGEDEYNVVASSIAPTLRRKSARNAARP